MLKSTLNMDQLVKECEGLSYWMDGAGVEMSITQSSGIPSFIKPSGWIIRALQEISDFRKATPVNLMINRLPKSVTVPTHRDYIAPVEGVNDPVTGLPKKSPIVERWHLPILTNDSCFWWSETSGKEIHLPVGTWIGPIPYWKNHYVKNLGDTERIHLIVDLNIEVPGECYN